MKLLQLAFAPLLIGACAAGAQTFPATAPSVSSPPADQSSFPQRYDVLTERNIFLRDRRRPSQPAPSSVPVRTAEQSHMLTGIVIEEGEFRAYFEDFRSASVIRVATGEPIARGRVAEIQFDAVAYESGAGMAWIEIGQDLTGTIVAAPLPTTSSTTAPISGALSAGATTAPAGAVDPATMSIEERMKLRRLQGN